MLDKKGHARLNVILPVDLVIDRTSLSGSLEETIILQTFLNQALSSGKFQEKEA